MEQSPIFKTLTTYVIFTSIAVTVFVSPWNSIDPVNLPKLTVLGILCSIAFGLTLCELRFNKKRNSRRLLIVLVLFTAQSVVALMLSPDDLSFHFYGAPGRNTGMLAYLFLSFLLLAAATSASDLTLRNLSYAIVGVGSFLGFYGLAQWRGLDIFDYVNGYSSQVFGTFGNPNFQSAFMGMTASVALTLGIFSPISFIQRAGYSFVCLIAILNIYLSSEQGYLNFIAGFIASTLVYFFSKRKIVLAWTGIALTCVGGSLVFAGILNNGPLANFLYKSSLQARGFYWQAAIKMMVEHPFFGVGLDGFGNWYRRARTEAVAGMSTGTVSDTAHSIPLDIGTGGGVPLLILYLSILGLALNAIVKAIKRSQAFDPVFAAIVGGWVAYQAQSFISINQLGLGVWGWSLTGLLIGYEINTREKTIEIPKKILGKEVKEKEQIPASAYLVAVTAAAIGALVSLPPYFAANKYYNALQSGDAKILYESTYSKPYERNRFLYTAQIMAENKLEDKAIQILSDASKIYPDSFELWQQWSQIASATPEQKKKALAEMKRLDPFNPELK